VKYIVFELVLAADWLSVTMETSAAPLIEMDSDIPPPKKNKKKHKNNK